MAINITLTLTTAGADTGPFNLFFSTDLVTPFSSSVPKSTLTTGLSLSIPESPPVTFIRVQSTGTCTNSIDISNPCNPTPTPTPSITPSITPSTTPSITATISLTPSISTSTTPSPTTSLTPTLTPSISISNTPGVSPSTTPSVTPSISISSTPEVSVSTTPSVTPSISISSTPEVSVSTTPSVTPSISISSTPEVSVSTTPSVTPSATPSATPSITPTSSPIPFYSYNLAYDASTSGLACTEFFDIGGTLTLYIDTVDDFESATVLSTTSDGATPATAGWYAGYNNTVNQTVIAREWNGSSFISQVTCTVPPSTPTPTPTPTVSLSITPSISISATPSLTPTNSPTPSPTPTEPLGACCDEFGGCTQTTQGNCPPPSTWTIGGTCDPNPCLGGG